MCSKDLAAEGGGGVGVMPKATVSAYQIPHWRLNEGVPIYRDKTSACIHMLISGTVANCPLKNRIILYLEKSIHPVLI